MHRAVYRFYDGRGSALVHPDQVHPPLNGLTVDHTPGSICLSHSDALWRIMRDDAGPVPADGKFLVGFHERPAKKCQPPNIFVVIEVINHDTIGEPGW